MVDERYTKGLSLRQRLAHCIEECGELVQALGKSARWGLDSYNPELPVKDRELNIDWILREWDDLKLSMNAFLSDFHDSYDSHEDDNVILKPTLKYKYCNHHHEITDEHSVVDFGDGDFIANNLAIPILSALSELGLKTRTHHVDSSGGFFSIILEEGVAAEVKIVSERDSTRDNYNGKPEIVISWHKC